MSKKAIGGISGLGPSFRQRIRNGTFAINQRAKSGTVTLAAGQYGHDGWKAGASGCSYTFALSGSVTTLTITAGTLIQIVEGFLYLPEGGSYVLSWTGTATARIYQGAATGSYGASPIRANGTTPSGNAAVEFGAGTLSLPQLEPGAIVTSFEYRWDELDRCRRYFRLNGSTFAQWYGTTSLSAPIEIDPPMLSAPTPSVFAGTSGAVVVGASFVDVTSILGSGFTSAGGYCNIGTGTAPASAGGFLLPGVLALTAEI